MTAADSGTNRASLIAGLAVAAGAILYGVVFTAATFARYANFRYVDFDLAVHTQSVWNILHGSLDCAILGIPFLGNHMVPILFLLAPFCTVLDPARGLLLIQSAVLAAGAWGLFLIGRRVLPLPWAVAWAFLYLMYPPLWYTNLYEFHPVVLATTFLIFTFHFYQQQTFRPYLVFLALALLCQENVALMVAGFGVLALFHRRKGRWVWVPVLAGAIYFVLATTVVMPRLNQGRMAFGLLYQYLGQSPGEIILNIFRHPIRVAEVAFCPEKLAFLGALLTPVAFLGLLSPATFIPLLPVLAQRLLSARATEASILFHYQAEFIPFIFVASIEGTRRVLAWKPASGSRVLAAILVAATALALSRNSILDLLVGNRTPDTDVKATCEIRWQALRRIPADAHVAATFRYLPPLAGRASLYSLHHIYTARYTLSTEPYPLPQDIDFVVLDALDPLTFSPHGFYGPQYHRNLQALLAQGPWDVVDQGDGFVVLHRLPRGSTPSWSLVEFRAPGPNGSAWHPAELDGGAGDIQLIGVRLGESDPNGCLPLTLCWTKPAQTDNDYDLLVELRDGTYACWTHLEPGNRIWPPQSWPAGKWILDHQRIHLHGHSGPLRTPRIKVHLRPIPEASSP